MKAITYGRVSRLNGREGDSFVSPLQQREAGEGFVLARGGEVVAHLEDIDVSGGTIDRPGFQRALAMIEAGEADTLVVAKLDRFARSLSGAYAAIERIEEAGGTFVSVADSFDLSVPTGRLMFNILASFAQFELDRMKAGWGDIHVRHVEAGVANVCPWGYVRRDGNAKATPGATREDRQLVATDEGREWIPRIFAWRVEENASFRSIASRLNHGGPTPPRGNSWTGPGVRKMLMNRAYVGEVRYGDLVNHSAHEPLVDLATFLAAQGAKGHARVGRTLGAESPALVRGILRCSSCRYAMSYMPTRPGHTSARYECQRKSHGCPAPVSILADTIESYIVEWAAERWEAERVAIRGERVAPPAAADLLARLERARVARGMFLDDPELIVALGASEYRAQLAKLDESIVAIEAELGEAGKPRAGDEPPTVEGFFALPMEDRRLILSHGIDAVFVRGRLGKGAKKHPPTEERVLILARGEGPSPKDLPRPGNGRGRDPLPEFVFPDDHPSGAWLTAS